MFSPFSVGRMAMSGRLWFLLSLAGLRHSNYLVLDSLFALWTVFYPITILEICVFLSSAIFASISVIQVSAC
jgi:hypothetical protein